MTHRILIVEDDQELASMVSDFLRPEGYEVETEGDGAVAARRIVSEPFDAVVLDIGLPGMDGISVCRSVRTRFEGPIVVLTARGDEIDEVIALEVGADDFMSKPVRPRALLSRLRIHLRRSELPESAKASTRIRVGDMEIDAASRTVTIDQQAITLTTAEFDLLWHLAEHAGTVVERSDIYQTLLGLPYDGLDRSIDLRISRIRKKLGDDPAEPKRIKSVRGAGYILAK